MARPSDEGIRWLLVKVLGMLDPVSVRTINAVLDGQPRAATVQIFARRLKELLDVVEDVRPGTMARYLELRAEAGKGS